MNVNPLPSLLFQAKHLTAFSCYLNDSFQEMMLR